MKSFSLLIPFFILLKLSESRYLFIDYDKYNSELSKFNDEYNLEDTPRQQHGNSNLRYLDTNKVRRGYYTKATFYSAEEVRGHMPAGGVRGVTLSQAIRGDGLLQVATDPRYIPMYTRMKVVWEGVRIPAIAVDIGGGVNGNMVDIFVDTNKEAINYGVMPIYVEILTDK
jgi:3D (Asp-Asp-Asp) domain-containing protein